MRKQSTGKHTVCVFVCVRSLNPCVHRKHQLAASLLLTNKLSFRVSSPLIFSVNVRFLSGWIPEEKLPNLLISYCCLKITYIHRQTKTLHKTIIYLYELNLYPIGVLITINKSDATLTINICSVFTVTITMFFSWYEAILQTVR